MDGRACDEIRPIWCEVNPLPMPHGSAYFQRGETLALATCTLGTKLDEKMVDNVLEWNGIEWIDSIAFNSISLLSALAKQKHNVELVVVK